MIKNIIASFILLLVLAGCKKNLLDKNEYWKFEPGNAYVKFIHAYTSSFPSTATPANGPIVTYSIAGTQVSGVNNNGVAYAGIFPAASGQYASVLPGSLNIKTALYRAAGAAALPTDVVADGSFTLNAGGYYSAFLVDSMPFPAATTPNMVIVPDSQARAKPGFFKIRFAHMMPTVDTLEIFSKNTQTVLFGNLNFKKVSPFIEMPLLSRNDTIQLRKKGTTAVLAENRPFFPASERVYTFVSRGIYSIAPNTSIPRSRTLAIYTNQ
jgi:Domain of unknown function (DUF4397)